MRTRLAAAVIALAGALSLDAKADGLPKMSPALRSMLGGLPIAQVRGDRPFKLRVPLRDG